MSYLLLPRTATGYHLPLRSRIHAKPRTTSYISQTNCFPCHLPKTTRTTKHITISRLTASIHCHCTQSPVDVRLLNRTGYKISVNFSNSNASMKLQPISSWLDSQTSLLEKVNTLSYTPYAIFYYCISELISVFIHHRMLWTKCLCLHYTHFTICNNVLYNTCVY